MKKKIMLDNQGKQAEYAGMVNMIACPYEKPFFKMIEQTLRKLIFSQFEWSLSEEEGKTIEHLLNTEGKVGAVISRLDVDNNIPGGRYIGKVGSYDQVDFYGYPKMISISGYNGFVVPAADRDSWAVGFDSDFNEFAQVQTPPLTAWVRSIAELLYNSFMAWQVTVETGKFSAVFNASDDKERHMIQDALNRINNNNPFLIVQGQMLNAGKNFLPVSHTPQVIDYYDNFKNAWAFIMDLCGWRHDATTKKERQLTEEITLNQSLAYYNSVSRYEARKRFAERLSDLFREQVTVKDRYAIDSSIDSDGGDTDAIS